MASNSLRKNRRTAIALLDRGVRVLNLARNFKGKRPNVSLGSWPSWRYAEELTRLELICFLGRLSGFSPARVAGARYWFWIDWL